MSGTTDALMVQILFATARGAGGMRISREASAWLTGRYRPWLTETKPGLSQPPIALWEDKGRGFLAKFKEIGERARETATGGMLRVDDLAAAAGQVELEATCPFCPVGPPPAGLEMETPLDEAVFGQIVFALARGAGEMRLSLDASAWFHERYMPWLMATKPELLASPLEVWEVMGKGFLSRFREIGKGIRSIAGIAGTEISREELQASAWAVESESFCPYCPTEPPLGVEEEDFFSLSVSGSGRLVRVELPA